MIKVALLLHGSNLDDLLAIGALLYLLVLFVLSRLRVRKLKREKLRRRAERARQLQQAVQQTAPQPAPHPSENTPQQGE